jgi:hypothetical protein
MKGPREYLGRKEKPSRAHTILQEDKGLLSLRGPMADSSRNVPAPAASETGNDCIIAAVAIAGAEYHQVVPATLWPIT